MAPHIDSVFNMNLSMKKCIIKLIINAQFDVCNLHLVALNCGLVTKCMSCDIPIDICGETANILSCRC